jgi:hypothetical protein
VLVVSDSFAQVGDLAQEIQYDLRYCRKIVFPGARIQQAEDPLQAATELLGFLFPLQMTTTVSPMDIRAALVDKLIARNLTPELVRELVLNFDEADCACLNRFERFIGSGTSQSP